MSKKVPAALKQKMAASVLGTAPSLVPQAPEPKQREVTQDALPALHELIDDRDDLFTLNELISAQMTLNTAKKQLEDKLEPIVTRIKAIIGNYGIDKANCDGGVISYYQTSRKTVNALKLVAAGVPEDVVVDCTDVSISHTLKIVPTKV